MIELESGMAVALVIITTVIVVTSYLVGYYSGYQAAWEATWGTDQRIAQQRMKEQREATQAKREAWIDAQIRKGN